jgi:hypothetical protein
MVWPKLGASRSDKEPVFRRGLAIEPISNIEIVISDLAGERGSDCLHGIGAMEIRVSDVISHNLEKIDDPIQ